MQMERQLRAGGGLMTLEEPRQGYFLGKIVKKAKRAVKKVVKSPIGKAALAAAAFKFGGPMLAKAFPSTFSGQGILGALGRGQFTGQGGLFQGIGGLFGKDRFLGSLVRDKAGVFSPGRAALLGLGAAGIAAPFFMGGDEEEVEEETPFTETPSSIANIVEQARNQDPSLRFLPEPKFVRNFYAADGGLATMRENFDEGKMALGEGFKSKELNDMALDMFGKNLRLLSRDELELLRDEYNIKKGMTEVEAKEGGIMDLGGMEKDYRTGGFVELGAEERADDVPARLSKNEFVFTADAVRNAGGGDIDRGAEVMQNMMDNLEAGGMISEESQGMNPAQEMFDQSQMLEGRLA
jgi:hypothetical protein